METYTEKAKELLDKIGKEKFQTIFSELMAIGLSYEVEPSEIVTILMIGEEQKDTEN